LEAVLGSALLFIAVNALSPSSPNYIFRDGAEPRDQQRVGAPQEVSRDRSYLSRKIKLIRKRARAKILESDYILYAVIGTFKRFQSGEQSPDPIVEINFTTAGEKVTFLKRLLQVQITVGLLLEQNRVDFLKSMDEAFSIPVRICHRRLLRGRRKLAARIVEGLAISTETMETLMERLEHFSQRMQDLEGRIVKMKGRLDTSNENYLLQAELDALTLIMVETPSALRRRTEAIKLLFSKYLAARLELEEVDEISGLCPKCGTEFRAPLYSSELTQCLHCHWKFDVDEDGSVDNCLPIQTMCPSCDEVFQDAEGDIAECPKCGFGYAINKDGQCLDHFFQVICQNCGKEVLCTENGVLACTRCNAPYSVDLCGKRPSINTWLTKCPRCDLFFPLGLGITFCPRCYACKR